MEHSTTDFEITAHGGCLVTIAEDYTFDVFTTGKQIVQMGSGRLRRDSDGIWKASGVSTIIAAQIEAHLNGPRSQ